MNRGGKYSLEGVTCWRRRGRSAGTAGRRRRRRPRNRTLGMRGEGRVRGERGG